MVDAVVASSGEHLADDDGDSQCGHEDRVAEMRLGDEASGHDEGHDRPSVAGGGRPRRDEHHQVGEEEELVLGCSDVLVAMGVWSTLTAPWFGLDAGLWPITGIKSTHTIWSAGEAVMDEPAALFCGEEANGTHLEIYPRSK